MLHHTPTQRSHLTLGEASFCNISSPPTKKLFTTCKQRDDSRLGPGGSRLCLSICICSHRVVSAQHIVHDALRHSDIHLQQGRRS